MAKETRECTMYNLIYGLILGNVTATVKAEYVHYELAEAIDNERTLSKEDHAILIEIFEAIADDTGLPNPSLTRWIIDKLPPSPGSRVTPIKNEWDAITFIRERCSDECGCPDCRPNWAKDFDIAQRENRKIRRMIFESGKLMADLFLEEAKGSMSSEQLRKELSWVAVKNYENLKMLAYCEMVNLLTDTLLKPKCLEDGKNYLTLLEAFTGIHHEKELGIEPDYREVKSYIRKIYAKCLDAKGFGSEDIFTILIDAHED